MENEKSYRPSLQVEIEVKFGRETLREVEHLSRTIAGQMQQRILEIGREEGSSSEEQKQKVQEYLTMWQEFNRSLFAGTSSANAKSPERVKIAINGAAALMAPEITGHENAARNIQQEIEKRYGKE